MRYRIARFRVTERSFVNDASEEGLLAYDSVMSPVYRIAEDALHLSDAFQSKYPDYPWNNIRGFRNFVAHGYREVDKRIAWKVVHESIPELEQILLDFVNDNETGADGTYRRYVEGCLAEAEAHEQNGQSFYRDFDQAFSEISNSPIN